MRRIAERTEIPTDKAELIQYLSERIKQAEVAPFINVGRFDRHRRTTLIRNCRTLKNFEVHRREKSAVIEIISS